MIYFITYSIHGPVHTLERRFGKLDVVFTEEFIARLFNPLATNHSVTQTVEMDNVSGLAAQWQQHCLLLLTLTHGLGAPQQDVHVVQQLGVDLG